MTAKAMTPAGKAPGRDKRYCGAKKHQGEGNCTRPAGWGTPTPGEGPCKLHGGCTPTVTRGSERQRAEREARKALEGFTEFEAVRDPIERLRLLAGRAEAWMVALEAKVAELTAIRYSAETAEQIRGEVQLYERAMTATGKVLVDLARLNLDERAIRLQEAQVQLLAAALGQALAEADLEPAQQQAIRTRVAELIEASDGQSPMPARRRLTA